MDQTTLKRIRLLNERIQQYKQKPQTIPKDMRQQLSLMFATVFHDFKDFCQLGMKFLGFGISPMQLDIADYVQHGAKRRMVQAQRGQAKTTITALYAVWRLIQDPTTRVLIVSAGQDQSNDIAVLVIRLIQQWPLMCWLRADTTRGDRSSYQHYDVNRDLRRVEKSASVSSVGIKANLPGRRADLIIADDVQSITNSNTQVMRDDLLNRTKEFAAICTHGDILYLGTPQTRQSIYKTLLGRGFQIRIWPGRYPQKDRLLRYLPNTLAPMIQQAIEADPTLQQGGGLDGTRGKPTDPIRYTEQDLCQKQLDYGPQGFDLQYMLDTTLADQARTRIKLSDLLIAQCGYQEAPQTYSYSAQPRLLIKDPELAIPPVYGQRMYYTARSSQQFKPYDYKVCCVDPAGNGGDELAYAIGGACNSYIHVFSVGGLQGGMTKQNINTIIDLCIQTGTKKIYCESNMGHGTVTALFIAELQARKVFDIGVQGYYNAIQKQKRIIDTISPVTRRHKLVMHQRAIRDDWKYCLKYTPQKRSIVSCLYQMANITYDRQSLAKDDRVDAVSDLVRYLSESIAYDDGREQQIRQQQKIKQFIRNPMGYSLNVLPKRDYKWNNLNKYSKVRTRRYVQL